MQILKKPLVTEKMTALNEKGKYAFEVAKTANKVEIKKAVEKLYGVTVEKVSTMRVQGKLKVKNTKAGVVSGRKPSYKKAIVSLKEGEFIDFYSGI
ncbi:50S ribosomal protein L23 [Adhaeribacter rhizoryzae]|jgi:large subunit ribosomal protein L23|uniref:Large ribosomal subunit protein uL23 n=1 Tax=Adhaeribacter rhizoryzae TaxID=2607907 RepID=A0A5M6DPG1_9BACT|nr:50S ribosomal protein L23 [Adhaeribacter rhizoryzae]KAA5549387.1 50S ribosomal protein L23 [Adhaeribacter rhizoryzae]